MHLLAAMLFAVAATAIPAPQLIGSQEMPEMLGVYGVKSDDPNVIAIPTWLFHGVPDKCDSLSYVMDNFDYAKSSPGFSCDLYSGPDCTGTRIKAESINTGGKGKGKGKGKGSVDASFQSFKCKKL
jgi:hypothetical protein